MKEQTSSDRSNFSLWLVSGYTFFFIWHAWFGMVFARILPETDHPGYVKYDAVSALSSSFSRVAYSGYFLVAAAAFLGLSIRRNIVKSKIRIPKSLVFLIPSLAGLIADIVFILFIGSILDSTFNRYEPSRFLSELNSHPVSWLALIFVSICSIGSCLCIQTGFDSIRESVDGEYMFNLLWFAMLEVIPWIFISIITFADYNPSSDLLLIIYALFILSQFLLHRRIYKRRKKEGIYILNHASLIVSFSGVASFFVVFFTFLSAVFVHF